MLDLSVMNVDHPQSAVVGLSCVLKFQLDPVCNIEDIVIFIFWHFGLFMPTIGGFRSLKWRHSSS